MRKMKQLLDKEPKPEPKKGQQPLSNFFEKP
jgi:hypothetical protein